MAHIKGKPAKGHVHNDMWYDPESNNFLIFNANLGRWNVEAGERWFPGLKPLRRLALSGRRLSAQDVVRLRGGKALRINNKGDLVPWGNPKGRNKSRLFLAQSNVSKEALKNMRFTKIPLAEQEELINTQIRNYRKRGLADNPSDLIAQIKTSRRLNHSLGLEAKRRILEQDFNLVEDSKNLNKWLTKTDVIDQTKKSLNNNKGVQEVPSLADQVPNKELSSDLLELDPDDPANPKREGGEYVIEPTKKSDKPAEPLESELQRLLKQRNKFASGKNSGRQTQNDLAIMRAEQAEWRKRFSNKPFPSFYGSSLTNQLAINP